MAKRLVEWPGGLIVFDVRTEAMTPLAELGATLADGVADVAEADVISVTVLNDEQVRDVVGSSPPTRSPVPSSRSIPRSPRHGVELAEHLKTRVFMSSTRR